MAEFIKEHTAFTLTSASNLGAYIPKLLEDELLQIQSEVKNKMVSVIFDGTDYYGEFFAVVFRYVTTDFQIKHRLVDLKMFESTFHNAKELCNALITMIQGCLQQCVDTNPLIDVSKKDKVVSFQKDRAAINGAAITTAAVVYNKAKLLSCLPHTLCHCGDRLEGPAWTPFFSDLNSLMSRSDRAKTHFRHTVGNLTPLFYRCFVTYTSTYKYYNV